jgi:hypothetical protein
LCNGGKDGEFNIKKSVFTKNISDNFEFPVGMKDVIFTLTINNSKLFKENVGNMISKMVILKEYSFIPLDELSLSLKAMRIEKLEIFSIDKNLDFNIKSTVSTKGSDIHYIEMNTEQFVKFINGERYNFLDHNPFCLYILRDGNFLDIKNLFSLVNNCQVNVGRGGSQKSHFLSPLDLRLTSYLMAMFNFNYKLVSELNIFNYLTKDKYLS